MHTRVNECSGKYFNFVFFPRVCVCVHMCVCVQRPFLFVASPKTLRSHLENASLCMISVLFIL